MDYSITKKAFTFPKKHGMPFYFVSASDGTNVVKVCKCGIIKKFVFIGGGVRNYWTSFHIRTMIEFTE